MGRKLNIRPTTSVYATYKNIKYDPWTAIAEFVDNSTQSYYDNIDKLKATKYWKGLSVEINYGKDENGDEYLEIIDNACGMNYHDFKRAIVLDSPPARSSRSEFGMGLKTAACWFGTKWSVETTELGSDVKYKTTIDVDLLQKYKNEEIEVEEERSNPKEHYTIVRIWSLNRKISGRQIGKTKDQLRGMYRVDLRTGDISIYYNGEGLVYEDPKVLKERLPDGTEKIWKKDIDFTLHHGEKDYPVQGFIAIREEGSTSAAGLTLIRHGRVIIGGYENAYRPEEVFEKTNSFVYQRLFGELNLDNWPVTQTKDAFDWYDGLEDEFIEKLVEECREYAKKAKEYRVRPKPSASVDVQSMVETLAGAGIINNVETKHLPNKEASSKQTSPPNSGNLAQKPEKKESEQDSIDNTSDDGRQITFSYGDRKYVFNFLLKQDDPNSNWLNITEETEEEYTIEWNFRHAFFNRVADDPEFMSVMQTFTFALALSEIESRRTATEGKVEASAIRMKMNETLKSILKTNY
jgi:DNA-binding Lrp family transcriptional regulator